MKQTLVIFSQGALSGQNLLEALSATLVMATYGMPLKICFQGDAISLLQPPLESPDKTADFFKSAFAMIDSFEYYDVLPVWVWPQSFIATDFLANSPISHELIELDSDMLSQFDQVIYW